jgi:hypothetical protein
MQREAATTMKYDLAVSLVIQQNTTVQRKPSCRRRGERGRNRQLIYRVRVPYMAWSGVLGVLGCRIGTGLEHADVTPVATVRWQFAVTVDGRQQPPLPTFSKCGCLAVLARMPTELLQRRRQDQCCLAMPAETAPKKFADVQSVLSVIRSRICAETLVRSRRR